MADQHQQEETQTAEKTEAYEVPQPPKIQKKWQFHQVQKIGVPLLALIPLLALFGVFGTSSGSASETGENFAVDVSYPTRYRYKMVHPMVVTIENISAQTVPTVTVAFDTAYISQFSSVSFTPSPSEIDEDAYYVQLQDVRAGEVRQVVASLQAERYWMHEGEVAVSAGDVDAAEDVALEVNTFVFP